MDFNQFSEIQKSIFLSQSIHNNSTLFNVSGYVRINGGLNRNLLKECMIDVFSRSNLLSFFNPINLKNKDGLEYFIYNK